MTTCESCGKKIDDNKSASDEEGNSYCNQCAEILQEACNCCGEKHQTWEMTGTSQDEYYCEKCATAIA